jgi:hypothetical protein
MTPYYGVRRLGPYLGVIQVIDVGDACAYSTNGRAWRIRQLTGSGQFRWGATLVSDENLNEVRIVNADNLLDALRNRPPVPFPIRDHWELWLLNKSTRKPLALLKTCYNPNDVTTVQDPHWRPFLMTDTEFVSPTLESFEAEHPPRGWKVPHRDQLERQINTVSRPLPIAQWFQRRPDGSGVGQGGLRVEPDDRDREMPAKDFPELLLSEDWPSRTERGLVQDYHHWHAANLLAHQNLSEATRRRLEQAACRRPQRLLSAYALIPVVLDQQAVEVALVSAKLMNSA